MYKSHELFATLSKEDRSASLSACVLPEKDEYTEDEMYRFRECLALREQGKTYEEIAQLFQQNGLVPPTTELQHTELQHTEPQHTEPDPQPQAKKPRNGKKLGKPLDISELLSFAREKCGTRIKLSEATEILASCGLPDLEEYTQDECDRFLEGCDLRIKQGKSYEEVAEHFGIGPEGTDTDIESDIDETVAALVKSGNGVVSEVMRHKAKVDASAAAELYLRHLANEFGSAEFQQAWNQMEEALKAKVVGKSHLRTRQMLGEIRAIPPSRSPLNALPGISDNGSTTD